MPEAGRLSDRAECKCDSHGCTGCSHSVIGPAVGGSPDVYINGRNALRVDDPGVHSSCCGPNTWKAQGGSPSVYANGKRLHRKGDATKHCGGLGKLAEGSDDVFAGGDGPEPCPPPNALRYGKRYQLVDPQTGEPLGGVQYRLVFESGATFNGTTAGDGFTASVYSSSGERVAVEIVADGASEGGE